MAIIKKFRIKYFKKKTPIIKLNKLSLSFGKRKILDNVSFTVNEGQVLGLLGPNGVGKSTIFNLITGLLKPDFGSIIIDNENVLEYPISERTKKFKIGYVPQYGGFFQDLTLMENLKAVSEITIQSKKDRNIKIDELISKFELDAVRKVQSKNLSGGLKRRLVIAMGLIGNPEILLMDEPLAALDPQTIQMLQNVIVTLQTDFNLTIIVTDHQARDLLAVCDKAVILSNSKIIAHGTPSELMRNENANKYYFGKNFKFK